MKLEHESHKHHEAGQEQMLRFIKIVVHEHILGVYLSNFEDLAVKALLATLQRLYKRK